MGIFEKLSSVAGRCHWLAVRIVAFLFIAIVAGGFPAQAQRDYDLRGQQFATCGTDFWVCFPTTLYSNGPNNPCLYVMSERNCELTISHPISGYSQTYPILTHRHPNNRLDTINLIQLPLSLTRFADTIDIPSYISHRAHGRQHTTQPGYGPQYRGAFHVTTTDTVALYLFVYAFLSCDVTNVLPTEMLRDEYVAQVYPRIYNTDIPGNHPPTPEYQFIDILATEDSTIIDITPTDWDWMVRPPDSTYTVTLSRGQLFHIGAGEVCEKYYPRISPYGAEGPHEAPILTHAFVPTRDTADTCIIDLSGTRIAARDHKRIAVFEGARRTFVQKPERSAGEFILEQAFPIRYAGSEYMLPNLQGSTNDIIRFTGLTDSTVITIRDVSRHGNDTRTLTVDAYKTDWFQMEEDEGPFYLSANHPFVVKEYSDGGQGQGDPAVVAPVPIKWWGRGMGESATIYWCDNNHNRYIRETTAHIFALTTGADSLLFDDYILDTVYPFTNVNGTDIEYTFIPRRTSFNSTGTHHVDNVGNTRYTYIMDSYKPYEHAIWTVAQWLPGGCFLKVDGVYADSLPAGRRCMLDTVSFHAWSERPADSITWDFGDGTPVQKFHYDSGQYITHRFVDTGFLAVRSIIYYADEGEEPDCIGCKSAFTLTPDTLLALLEIRGRYDTSFTDTACFRTYTFRGQTYTTSGLKEFSTYWHPSGCDTFWHINLTVCPHCSADTDTVYSDQLPWNYHGTLLYREVKDYDVSFDIGKTCDSLVSYTLVVITTEQRDSIITHATPCFYIPNIFTPGQESNREFRIIPDKITQMEVTVFDRRGIRVAKFDGLTEAWDGTYNGQRCPQGAYVYFIRYRDTLSEAFHTAKGTITLIR